MWEFWLASLARFDRFVEYDRRIYYSLCCGVVIEYRWSNYFDHGCEFCRVWKLDVSFCFIYICDVWITFDMWLSWEWGSSNLSANVMQECLELILKHRLHISYLLVDFWLNHDWDIEL